ncbi:MAG: MFS transporter [Bacteroidales bacterium]|nr:MFS transporter [Bacteroidales bacterium]
MIGLRPASDDSKQTSFRWVIVSLLFLATSINYADRTVLSIAGPALAKSLHLNSVSMGYIFSAFGWSYVLAQLPGGWLLDRFGSRKVYAVSLFAWSFFTFITGFTGFLAGFTAVAMLFTLRFMLGIAEAPSFPANSRISVAWFPTRETGTAAAIFNSAQYFATVLFAPLLGYIVQTYGWNWSFIFMGITGFVFLIFFVKYVNAPKRSRYINKAELDYITKGGALVEMDHPVQAGTKNNPDPKWRFISQLMKSRMLIGVYIAQYCINAITFFFITWFPVYLVQARGMTILKAGIVAVLPAIFGFVGGNLGGLFSDHLLKKGLSLSFSRKLPIVAGMLLSMSMIFCNFTDVEWMVVAFMSLSYFGKGIGALGWAVNADTAPKEITGLSGGLFNTFGNLSSIVTPIAIGYIINVTGSFNWALIFVSIHAFTAIVSYLLIVGKIQRLELKIKPK